MRWASCRPFIEPGIWTSVKTAETSIRFSSIEIASIAFSASMTAHPAAWTASAVAHRSRTSSSTTSTRGRLHAWCCIITGFLGISQDALEDLRPRVGALHPFPMSDIGQRRCCKANSNSAIRSRRYVLWPVCPFFPKGRRRGRAR
jgi:hypothetical protein